ncbi:MAG TPA: hypothetical protein PLB32_26440, partial [Acidobacteriota bacterium]|nr:hypothetical protein [Acidobacteriota bacterium]
MAECFRGSSPPSGIGPVTARDLEGVGFVLSPAAQVGTWRHLIPPVAPGATLCDLLRRPEALKLQLTPKNPS